VSAVGERHTYTVPGKDTQIRIESEQWFSPELGVVVMNAMSVWVSPKANMKVTYRLQITRGEPDPALFRVPRVMRCARWSGKSRSVASAMDSVDSLSDEFNNINTGTRNHERAKCRSLSAGSLAGRHRAGRIEAAALS
jgi:hypothetical protein